MEDPGRELTAQLQAAKTDKRALNALLRDYMPFIQKCAGAVFFKDQSKADNLTDAMLAFARSVQTYNPEHGAFVQYAAAVIRNRLIDNARKEQLMHKRFALFPARATELAPSWETDASLETYDRAEDEQMLRLEIEDADKKFALWGFSWATLQKKCPKQERSRRLAFYIAQTVLSDPEMLADTLKNRQLPFSRLAETFPRKALEKYRQYIAAIIMLSQGDYPYIYSFIPNPLFTGEETT